MNFFNFRELLENKRIKEVVGKTKKQPEKHVVFSFGRNQPPTAGHGHIINHVVGLANEKGADHVVFTSGTGPTHEDRAMREKNPLHPQEKVEIMRDFFPGANIQHHEEVLSPFHAIDHLKKLGYTHATMVVGADRLPELSKRMAPYGATNFKGFKVVSPGEKRIDVGGKEVSGTAARKHAARGDYKSFREIMPSAASDKMVKKLYNRLRQPVAAPVKKKVKKKTTKKRKKIVESSHSHRVEIDAIRHLKPHSIFKKLGKSHSIRSHKKHHKIKIKKLAESIMNFLNEERPRTAKEKTRAYYAKEYRSYQSSKKAITQRGERWTARRRAAVRAAKRKLGSKSSGRTRDQLIKIGQKLLKGKDVDHKKALSKGGTNGNGNTRVVSTSYNRSRNNN